MANHPANTECPAVVALGAALRAAVPLIRAEPSRIGTIRHDGSRHTAGVAMDIMLDSRLPAEKAVGDAIIAVLIALHARMGWFSLIYTDWDGAAARHFIVPGHPSYLGAHLQKRTLRDDRPGEHALGVAHENHVHVDWCHPGLRVRPEEAVFVYDWPASALPTDWRPAMETLLAPPPAPAAAP